MVSSIERFHCIQDSQLGPSSVLYREVPLYTGQPAGSQQCPLQRGSTVYRTASWVPAVSTTERFHCIQDSQLGPSSVHYREVPLYTGQPAGSQQCPLQRGSTVYRTASWVPAVFTIKRFHCIQDSQLGPSGVLYREVPLYTGQPAGSQQCPLQRGSTVYRTASWVPAVSSTERFHCIQDSQLGPSSVLYREVPLYTGQPAGSQQCPLQRGSTVYRTASWVPAVSTIERFHCIQDNQLGPSSVHYREVPLYTGQPAGSQQCPLQRGSTVYRTASWVPAVSTIERFHCIYL